MASVTRTMLLRAVIFSAVIAVTLAQTPPRFTCKSTSKCRALIDYIPVNATTIAAVQSLFEVENLRSFLGANNLPANTSSNSTLPAAKKIKIPFHCKCENETGLSDGHPVYKIQSGETLDIIAESIFSRLVTFQQIAAANKIQDPNKVTAGQEVRIPLPCSCDEVEGKRVVHYGHLVESGSSVSAIAARFDVSDNTILQLNGIANPADLKASQVLDVPLAACSSVIRQDPSDFPLLLSNDTYDYTANDCVLCECNAAKNLILDCKPSQLKPSSSDWATCPAMACNGSSLFLGNSTVSGCNTTTCAYAGFSKQHIFTTISNLNTCPQPEDNRNNASRTGSRGLSLAYFGVFMHLLCFGLLLI